MNHHKIRRVEDQTTSVVTLLVALALGLLGICALMIALALGW